MHGGITIVSLLLMAEPVHLAITLSMHFLWMAALHSKEDYRKRKGEKRSYEKKMFMKAC